MAIIISTFFVFIIPYNTNNYLPYILFLTVKAHIMFVNELCKKNRPLS